MGTSWGQRKALGRRYSVDPALIEEQQRLAEQYGLAPGREARALSASQFSQSQAQQESQFARNQAQTDRLQTEAANQAAKSGMVGTVGNVATTGLMLKYLGGKSGGMTYAPSEGGALASQGVQQAGSMNMPGASTYSGVQTSGIPTTNVSPYSTTPAMTDTAATTTAEASGMTGTAAGAETGATFGGAGTAAMSAAPYAVAGRLASKYGGEALERNAGGGFIGGIQETMGKDIKNAFGGPGREFTKQGFKQIFGEDTGKHLEEIHKVFSPATPVEWIADFLGW